MGIILFLKFCFFLDAPRFIAFTDIVGFGLPSLTPRCFAFSRPCLVRLDMEMFRGFML